jgi:hypothetical protein
MKVPLPGGAPIVTWHLGEHAYPGDSCGPLNAWLDEHGHEAGGPVWEIYWWIDASRKPDPSPVAGVFQIHQSQ